MSDALNPLPENPHRVLRWSRLLREMAAEMTSTTSRGGARSKRKTQGWSKLVRAIEDANMGSPQRSVDWRRLKELAQNEDGEVRLSVNEMIALDRFFTWHGRGSVAEKGLFETSILEPAAYSRQILFLLGASEDKDERWNVVRRWDVQAMAELQRAIGCINPRATPPDIKDVLRNEANIHCDFEQEPWYRLIHDESENANGACLIAIGSPLANPAAEILLAKMFEVEPFCHGRMDSTSLPFHFVWPVRLPYPSSFALLAADLKRIDRNAANAVLRDNARVLKANYIEYRKVGDGLERHSMESVFTTPWKKNSVIMYSVVAAQRRRNGQILVVVAGVSGPGTSAAASFLAHNITHSLPESGPQAESKSEDAKVLWAVLKNQADFRPERRGDECRVGTPTLAIPMWQEWPP